MSFGKEQMAELMRLLIGEPEVQELFSYDELPSIDDRAAVDIDKKKLKVQELLAACARLDETVNETTTKTKKQLAGELALRKRLVKAQETLAELQARKERTRKRQKTLTENEKWKKAPKDAW